MFLLKGFWSIISQGFTGTTEPEADTSSPGRTSSKSTIVLGGGWPYDPAEAARVKAADVGPQSRGGRLTVQGEQRALAAKTKAGAFDMRTPRRRPPSPRTPQQSARSRGAERRNSPRSQGSSGSPSSYRSSGRSTPRSPHDRECGSPIPGDALWNDTTQGYAGISQFKTLTAANAAGSPMRTPADQIFGALDPRGRAILYDP